MLNKLTYTPKLTEDGKSIAMEDGWPLVTTPDGKTVPWNITKQAGALKDAEGEAKTRRLALEAMANDLKLDADIRKKEGLQMVLDAVAAVPIDSEELKRLRELEAAGELGEEATQSRIDDLAEEKSKGKLAKVEAEFAKARREAGEFKAQSDRATAELMQAMTRQGVEAFFDRAVNDKSGKLPNFQPGARQGFLNAVMMPGNGSRWIWNQKRDASGVPEIVQVNSAGEVVKGPDNIDPLTLTHFSKETLCAGHPYLFQPEEGSTGVDAFGQPGAKSWGEQSQADIDAAAAAQAAAATG